MVSGVVHSKRDPFDDYIGRPSPWGNPYRMDREADRECVISRFRRWADIQPWFRDAAYWELQGRVVGCHCAPKACHGDVYREFDTPAFVFVFGSNLAGRHGKGAARYAATHWGAVQGQGRGMQGRSYGVPTKDERLRVLPILAIGEEVGRLFEDARALPQEHFQVTRLGCGLAGYADEEIIPLFESAPANIHLPGQWVRAVNPKREARVLITGVPGVSRERLFDVADRVAEKVGRFEVVSGASKGPETVAESYAEARGLHTARFPALHRKEGRSAIAGQTARMLWYATHVVAFWDGQHQRTKSVIEQAKAEGLPLMVARC